MGVQPNKKNSFPNYVIDIASERPARVDSCIERLARLIYVNENDTNDANQRYKPNLRHSCHKERNRTSIPVFPPYAPAFSPVSVWNCACPKPIAQSRFAHRCGQAGKKHILLQFLFSCSIRWTGVHIC